MAERQVKSRERVADHGEVFTAEREVNAMLDLVKQETERIDSRFLEKTLPTLIQTNETYESTQIDAFLSRNLKIDAFFEPKPKIDAFLKIDANGQRKEYKKAS